MRYEELKYSVTDHRYEQIEKILKYGKEIIGLDVRLVESKDMGSDSGGYIAAERKEDKPVVLVENNYRGLQLILILLHEFGHHIDFLKNGESEVEEDAYQYYPESKLDAPCPNKYAKHIRNVENRAIKYSQELAIYLDLKLPYYSLIKDEFYTKLALEEYLEKGFTTSKTRAKIRRKAARLARERIKSESRSD